MSERIYLCLAHMSGQEEKYIKEAFDTNWVVPLGPNVNAFEEDLKRFVESMKVHHGDTEDTEKGSGTLQKECSDVKPTDSTDSTDKGSGTLQEERTDAGSGSRSTLLQKEVVALSAGTAAVHLALIAVGVKPGDEVICQSFTFCASCHPITYLGATPVLVDSEPDTWNMDPTLLEEAIKDRIAKTGRKPKAIVPVYLYGMPAKIDEIMEIANRYDIPVIEDAAEGLGSRYRGQVCGTFGEYGVLSFNGNKMITTSGGGALICPSAEAKKEVMFYATQAREAYPYYQHERIGYNYRMSNICAGIGRGQMTVLDEHIRHHQRLAEVYKEEFAKIDGIDFHDNPCIHHGGTENTEKTTTDCGSCSRSTLLHDGTESTEKNFDSNFWLNTIVLSPDLKIKGEDRAYAEVVKGAVGGAAGVTHASKSAHTECEPNRNVEALRMWLDEHGIESRPLWKPMHLQPCYKDTPAYVNGVSEGLFKRGLCLPSGPMVTEEQARWIVEQIREAIA